MSELQRSSNTRTLRKGAQAIGSATALSRVLGFVRDVIIARFFGTGIAAQAFVVAFRVPNLLRDFVAEGATNAAVVPILNAHRDEDSRDRFWQLVRTIGLLLFIALAVITVTGVFLSPLIVRLLAPGFMDDPAKFALTVRLTRIMFPFIFLIGLSALSMGVLNTLRHFTIPALGPATLNVCLITAALVWSPRMDEAIMALAGGVLVGGILQLGMQMPVLFKYGFRLWGRYDLADPDLKKMGRILVPRVVASCVHQLSVFVDTILASLGNIVGSGGVAALYYANRLVQLPLAVFAIAMAQALLPVLSTCAHANKMDEFRATLERSLRMVFFLMIPASVGLAVLARPITQLLFERGKFGEYSTSITSSAVLFYSLGLFAYAGIKILVSAFHALRDTKTPLKIAAIALAINIILNCALMRPMKIGGLALATSCASIVNFGLLFMIIRRRLGGFDMYHLLRSVRKNIIASICMSISCALLAHSVRACWPNQTLLVRLAGVMLPIAGGIMMYVLASHFLHCEELKECIPWDRVRRLKKK